MNTVSVITRTKDRGILLRRAIQSVISQTHQNWELIIVNDGGAPSSVEEIVRASAYSSQGRIKVIHNSTSLGMEAASNAGIRQSTGDYLVIHDDDDSWTPVFLEIALQKLRSHKNQWPSVRGIVVRATRVIEEIKGEVVITHKKETFRPDVKTGLISVDNLLQENLFAPIQFLYEKQVLDEVGFYREDLPVLGDWEFNIRFIKKYDIAQISDEIALYHHRLTDKNSAYGNSVIASHEKHIFYNQALKNEWMRADLKAGRVGISSFQKSILDGTSAANEISIKLDKLIRYNILLGLKAFEKRIRNKIRRQ